jgi:hypothetical protein
LLEEKNLDYVSKALTYVPQKEKGEKSLDILSSPFRWFGSIGDEMGDEVLDVTGSSNTAAFISSLFKSIPALATLFTGTPSAAVGPGIGYLARRNIKIPGTSRLSKKINAKIETAANKQFHINLLKKELESLKVKDFPSKDAYFKARSLFEDKLTKTGVTVKGKSYKTQKVAATAILATREFAKGKDDEKRIIDQKTKEQTLNLMSPEEEKFLARPTGDGRAVKAERVKKLEHEKFYRTFTMGPDDKLIRGTVTQSELDERKQKAIKKYGIKPESRLSQFEYFTNYGGETVGYSSEEEYKEAIKRFTDLGTKGIAKDRKVGKKVVIEQEEAKKLIPQRKTKEDLLGRVFSFGEMPVDKPTQLIKSAFDCTQKLLNEFESGKLKQAMLGEYKNNLNKGFEDTLSSTEQERFEKAYITRSKFISKQHLQARKALKNTFLPGEEFHTPENTALHNKVIGDAVFSFQL